MSEVRETWCLSFEPGRVVLRGRIDRPDGTIGDAKAEILPGQTVAGLAYEQWREIPPGEVVVVFEGGRAVRVERGARP